jgi:hypothetical protein
MPNVYLGMPANSGMKSPATAPGAAVTPPGAARSESSAGLAPPGNNKQPDPGASDKKLSGAEEPRLSQLPTCR